MSDDRRTRAVALPGDPGDWESTLRDLLEELRTDPAGRDAVVRRLGEASDGTDRDDATEQVEFLVKTGLLDASGDDLSPGPYGREFLAGDEGAIYESLTDTVGGFETLLSSLVVRPLTDVEFGDLLEREFDADLGSIDPIVPHRQWLVALGYVDHDDGINELTRAGRRRVATDDDLEPPGSKKSRRAEPADDGTEAGAGTRSQGPSRSRTGRPQGDPGEASEATPSAVPTDGSASDDPFADLKRRYDHACMVCGERRRRAPDQGFALVHHPMPTGEAHGGPAVPENAVVVCPNHRADFAFGLLRVDPRTLEIDHVYDEAASGRTLATVDDHDLGAQYLAYHNQVVAEF